MTGRDITLSVVSHGQNALVNQLLGDVERVCAGKVALVLTQNAPDPTPLSVDSGERFQVKRLMVKPGHALSLQLHRKRAELHPGGHQASP